jgi:hypothetical protein
MMKRVRINVGKVGVVNRRGDYDRCLQAGSHILGFRETMTVFEMSKVFTSTVDLDIMLRDEKFKELVEVIDVGDSEIVLKYTRNNFDCVLRSGRYFYFKGLMDFKFVKLDLRDPESASKVDQSVLKSSALSPFVIEHRIASTEEGLLFIDGKFMRKLTKGLYYFFKGLVPVEVFKVDLRQIQLEVSGQELLTKDKAGLRINFYANYRVVDSVKAMYDNKDFEKQLYTLIQLGLREFVGTLTLDELLATKETASEYVLKFLELKSNALGVEVMSAGIRDIILPGEMKDIMNKVLIAQKSAEASIIERREETAATRSLLNTAKLMQDNEMLYKLKEMEYVEKIADKIGEVTVSSGGQVVDQLTKIFAK